MSRISLQDSINPKSLSEDIVEEHPRQLAPSVGNLQAPDQSSADLIMSSTSSSAPPPPALGSPIRFGSYEFTPHSDSSRSNFSDLQGNMEMTIGSVHYNVNAEGILQLLESPTSESMSPSASTSLDLLAGLTESMDSPAPSTPRSASSMSVGSDEPMSSELTSYYCSNCDARHGLGSSDTPFICNARYSSGEDSVGSIVPRTTRRTAHHQVYVANNTGNTRHGGDGDRTPRSSRRASFENSASNRDSDYTIADEEWAAARTAVLNNTPLPAGTSVGTLNAYRSILEKNREHLSREQATLERRLSAAERSSERRRASQGSASRSALGAGKHRSRLSRLSEDDAREITSNLTKSFMTTDTAGMPRPKNVAGATANLAAYLINQRPEGSMAQAHRGALESLAILGNNLVPQKEKTTAQASGSKHRARDARDEITQSRIDKARRRRAARKDDDSDSSDEDQEYDGELRGADCLSYKIRETMPPKKFKPTPTDAAKYDGQQEPRSWIDDYLQTVILHKGNQIAAMQCLQLYLKDSARAWLRGLPKGSIKSWDDLVDAFVANFQATYKRPVGIEELRSCQQKQKESMRSYIGRFTKLLNAAEDVSVDRAIDAFSDGVRRESYIEELGRKKPKTITKLMEIANSWADGEDNVRRPRQRSDDEDDDQPKHDSGSRRDRNKRRKNRNYDDNNLVAAGYSDRHDDRYDERRDDRQDGNRNNSGNRGNYKPRQQRAPELPYAEQINAPCYLHSFRVGAGIPGVAPHHISRPSTFNVLLGLLSGQQALPPPPPPPPQHQVQQAQPHQPNEAFPPPRGQMSMIHKTGVSRREMKKLTREINLAESIMANIPEYVEWSSQNITFSRADHPMTIPKPGHAALVVEAQIGGFKMSKVFMDGGSGLNLIFVDTIKSMGITMGMLEETDTCFHGILPTGPGYSLGRIYLNVVFGRSDNFRKEKIEFEVVNWESQYHAILGRPAYAKFMAVPHYAYLKLKMPGNKGTNITVHGSFSRSDSCDRDFQRIAAKFGSKQEFIKPPPKLLLREIKEEKDDRGSKRKPADLALKASTAEASAAGALATKASAVKGSAVDDAEDIENSKTLAVTAQTPGEINNAAATPNMVKKPEEEKNPFLA
ncbi:hypothetical protein QYE76_051092 [Lolium multiflorum]|uniref:Retrotransposon gag domain-containing protein n=1 Tax=Lolium multiflorum TaxID=4521 RepID=A0AAD8WJU2_LOLMU|nr:hypothetical protein QYE76_051092 [Lolium multiflorum]